MTSALSIVRDPEPTALSVDTLSALVLNGDFSKLTQEQRLEVYIHRCRVVGLDPATKPFDFILLGGKLVMYATKECSSQLSKRDSLSATLVSKEQVGDIYSVTARASGSDRETDDIGCVPIKGLVGEALCNAMMKAVTKAKRRAILTHCGLGMLDETEALDVAAQEKAKQEAKPAKTYKLKAQEGEAVHDVKGGTWVTPPAPEKAEEIPTVIPDEPKAQEEGVESVVAVVQATSQKPGTGKNGKPYVKYGVHLRPKEGASFWANTFSKTLADTATDLKGLEVVADIKKTEYGFDLVGIIPAGAVQS